MTVKKKPSAAKRSKTPAKPLGLKKIVAKLVAKPTPRLAAVPMIEAADVRKILGELARTLAPADIVDLVAHEDRLRAKIEEVSDRRLSLFREQSLLAIDCLRDHVDEECPQIPLYTIAVLAGAVAYLAEDLDVIPDFLPGVGQFDDAVVMALAFQLGSDGIRRYCDWKGIPSRRLLRKPGDPAA